MSVLPLPPIHKGKKFVVLSDWVSFVGRLIEQADAQDGTITDKDSNDYMTDNIGM
jgi:2-hydroxy-3-keto-5-methylthiopentenyl-1-phosphate phosphatase